MIRLKNSGLYKKIMMILILAWMILIFLFSNQPADVSTDMSGSVSYKIVTIYDEIVQEELSENERVDIAEMIDYPVRKAAHMTEYAILGSMVLALLSLYSVERKRKYVLSGVWVFVYACTDEFHQLFVAGRSGQFKDVLIDTSGAVIAFLIIYFICTFIFGKKADL